MDHSPKIIKRLTVADEAYSILKQRIISGVYKSGYQLRQDELANNMGLSRIPLREAMLRLQAEGLIDLVAHKGGVVKALSMQQATELFELRLLIECDLLAKSIPLLSDDHLIIAEKALKMFDGLSFVETNIDNATELNWQFHLSLYQAAQRPETIKILRNLHSNSDRYIRQQLLADNALSSAHNQHLNLLKHCQNRDVKAAVAELENHINDVFQQLLSSQTLFE